MDSEQIREKPKQAWKLQSRNKYEELDDIHQFIVDCRLIRIPYRMIAEKIKEKYQKEYKVHTIEDMIAQGGMCYEAYVYMEKQRIIKKHKDAEKREQQLREGAVEALELLEQAMYDDAISQKRILVAQDYLDRAGVPKGTKVENSGSVNIHHGLAQDIKSILEK